MIFGLILSWALIFALGYLVSILFVREFNAYPEYFEPLKKIGDKAVYKIV